MVTYWQSWAFLSYLWQIYHVSPGHACSKFHLLALAQALPWLPLKGSHSTIANATCIIPTLKYLFVNNLAL